MMEKRSDKGKGQENMTKKIKSGKRWLALLLCMVMILGNAFSVVTAASVEGQPAAPETENVAETEKNEGTFYIKNASGNRISVAVKHYKAETKPSELYRESRLAVEGHGKAAYARQEGWEPVKVVIREAGQEEKTYTSQSGSLDMLSLGQDAQMEVYYSRVSSTVRSQVSFYDYTSMAGISDEGTAYSINASDYLNGSGNKVISAGEAVSGEKGQQYEDYAYSWSLRGAKVNGKEEGNSLVKGLLKGLDSDGAPVFQYSEPGLFSENEVRISDKFTVNGISRMETRELKRIYRDYALEFSREGDSYVLDSVYNRSNKKVAQSGEEFWPLDGRKQSFDETRGTAKASTNPHFGMRYDVDFTLGDYVGGLGYAFSGGDDMWVILDGTKVVLDMGGIHDNAEGSVDLWRVLLGKSNYTQKDKENYLAKKANRTKTHRLTVLYMERNASASSCNMKFTLPSAKFVEVEQGARADLVFRKVDAAGAPVEGAVFELRTDDGRLVQNNLTANSVGTVTVEHLLPGTYLLKETHTPAGYLTGADTWKVIVVDGAAQLYSEDGSTGLTQIKNYKAEQALSVSQTAKMKDSLERSYQVILGASSNMTEGDHVLPLEGVTVTDYIDSRFELLGEDGSPAKVGDVAFGGGVVVEKDGVMGVCWENQTVKAETTSGGKKNRVVTPGWTRNFYVRAKDDFMGGNKVPLTAEASSVEVQGADISLPVSAVNVRLVALKETWKELTMLKGDVLEPESLFVQMAQQDVKISGPKDEETFALPEESLLSEEEVKRLLAGDSSLDAVKDSSVLTQGQKECISAQDLKAIVKEYKYPGTNEVMGHFVYTLAVLNSDGAAADTASHALTTVGSSVETCELTVEFAPLSLEDREALGVIGSLGGEAGIEAGTAAMKNPAKSDNFRVIHVEAGQIQIRKNLEGEDADAAGSRAFVYQVTYQAPGEEVVALKDVIVTVPAGIDSSNVVSVPFAPKASVSAADSAEQGEANALPRGTYTITEKPVVGYRTKSVSNILEGSEIGTTAACVTDEENTSVTFKIGQNVNGEQLGLDEEGAVTGLSKEQLSSKMGLCGVATFTGERHTSQVHLRKQGEKEDGSIGYLSGAAFLLEKKEANGSWSSDSSMVVTEADGTANLSGLTEGVYRLTEIPAAGAGAALGEAVEFALPYAFTGEEENVTVEGAGKMVDGTEYYYDVTYTITADGKEADVTQTILRGEAEAAEAAKQAHAGVTEEESSVNKARAVTPALAIRDDIINSGNLEINWNGTVTNPAIYTYTWYKRVNGDANETAGKDAEVVKRKMFTNGKSNLDEDRTWLNVPLDGGALNSVNTAVKYQVKATDKAGNSVVSDWFKITYYNEIRNGGFDTPMITEHSKEHDKTNDKNFADTCYIVNEANKKELGNTNTKAVVKEDGTPLKDAAGNQFHVFVDKDGDPLLRQRQYTNENYKKFGGVWQSTGRGTEKNRNNIEIVGGNYPNHLRKEWLYEWENDDWAADGKQFAEINCEGEGALYQDVMTLQGVPLNYWLSHRARGTQHGAGTPVECDTMYVIIMPTKMALNSGVGDGVLDTQTELREFLKKHGVDESKISKNQKETATTESQELLHNQDGIYAYRITSDDRNWDNIERLGEYVPISGMTRFFFMSGPTASNNATVGNFVDRIGFSQALPPAEQGKLNVQVKKTVKGLNETELATLENTLKLTIQAKDKEGNVLADAPLHNTELVLQAGLANNTVKKETGSDGSVTYTWPTMTGNLPENNYDATYIYSVTESGEAVLTTDNVTKAPTMEVTVAVTNGTVQSDGQSALLGNTGSATFAVTNTYPEYMELRAEKVWEDDNDSLKERQDVLFGLFVDNGSKMELQAIQKMAKDDAVNNKTTMSTGSVPKYYLKGPNKGELISYSIKEIVESTAGEYAYLGNKQEFTGKKYSILHKGDSVDGNYVVSSITGDGTADKPFTITNTLRTYEIKVKKTAGDTGDLLAGVEFELRQGSETGTPVAFTKKADGEYVYAGGTAAGTATTTKVATSDKTIEGTDGSNLQLTGLPKGLYYLVETKSSFGYSLLANPIRVQLPMVVSLTDQQKEDGNYSDSYYYSEDGGVDENGADVTTYYYGSVRHEITNNKLFGMPESGAWGYSMWLTFAGAAMVLLAAGYTLHLKKKKR